MTTNWRNQAACRNENPEMFYLEDPRSVETAKLVCRGCPVQTECILDGERLEDWWSVRGGLPGPTRRRLANGKPIAPRNIAVNVADETLQLIRDGWTAANVAGYLGVSKRTVERHLARHRKMAAA